MREYTTYGEFFPYYLQEHARPATRYFHYAGSILAIIVLTYAIASGNLWLLLLVPVSGYFFAWISHAFVERNKPATFTYPLWSLRGDYHMLVLAISGKLNAELERAGVGRRTAGQG
ncbi:Mpo1-like protein [Hyphobacterium sp.]|uniref:Mpo1-like protein n=1 Tax=Hyphobacterium sp. TaxID=2004662 RepID=UPI003B52D3BA